MSRKQLKFLIGPIVIVLTIAWIGYTAFDSTMAYYQTVSELYAMADTLDERSLKVMGEVVPGSIRRQDGVVQFTIHEGGRNLAVRYVGRDPLPDTFRDYAEAIVDGRYEGEGVFTATKLQAKCASKYERELEAGVIPAQTSRLQNESPAAIGY